MMQFTNDPHQKFASVIDGIKYDFELKYNAGYDFWSMYILLDGATLVAGVKLVSKTNLLAQYPGIPFEMYSQYEEDANGENITEFIIDVSLKDG